MTVPLDENTVETYHLLKPLYHRWIRPEQHPKEEIGETIVMEQLLCILPPDVRTWVKEHEPLDGLMASRLALEYRNARRGPAAHIVDDSTRPTPQPLQQRAQGGQDGDQSVALKDKQLCCLNPTWGW